MAFGFSRRRSKPAKQTGKAERKNRIAG